MKKQIDIIILLILIMLTLALAVKIEYILYGSVPLRGWVVYCVLCLIWFLPFVIWRYRSIKLYACAAFLVLLAGTVLIPWTPGQRFFAAVNQIKPGMSRVKLDAIMRPYKNDLHIYDERHGVITYSWLSSRCLWIVVNVTVVDEQVTKVEIHDTF